MLFIIIIVDPTVDSNTLIGEVPGICLWYCVDWSNLSGSSVGDQRTQIVSLMINAEI